MLTGTAWKTLILAVAALVVLLLALGRGRYART
jgi:hypothetical protein